MRHLLTLALATLTACTAAAQNRVHDLAPSACQAELKRLCPNAGSVRDLRLCARANFSSLSQACRQGIRAERDDGAAGPAQPAPRNEDLDNAEPVAGSLRPSLADVVYRPPPQGVPKAAVSLDFYRAANGSPAPIVVFVHGGAWQIGDKRGGQAGHPAAFVNAGYAYASVNYRLLEYGRPHVAADDIAAAIAYLRANAPNLSIDPDRIILMGHSAGAHLAALVALDPRYLSAHDTPVTAVRALVLLDGAGYDIQRQIEQGGNAALYRQVFGDDPADWAEMSPQTYASRRDAPATLAHYVARRTASGAQARALIEAITAAGGRGMVYAAENETHASINRGFGEDGDETTSRTLKFLDEIFRP